MPLPNLFAFLLFIAFQVQAPSSPALASAKLSCVPDVAGKNYNDARAALSRAGFFIRQQAEFHDTDLVGEQIPKAGELHPAGNFVVIAPNATPAPDPAPEPEPAKPIPVPESKPAVPPVPDVAPLETPMPSVLVYKAAFGNHTKRGVLPEDLPDGVYLLKVAGGVKTLEAAEELVLDGPGPLPPPVPGTLSDRAKAIKAAADKAVGDAKRAETAQGLAAIYREIASNAKAPATPETISGNAIRFTDFITDHQGSTAAWAPMRELLRGQIADAIQNGNGGKPVTVEQLGTLLSEAADGLEASAPKQAGGVVYKTPAGNSVSGISPEFWQFLLELLKILQQLFLK